MAGVQKSIKMCFYEWSLSKYYKVPIIGTDPIIRTGTFFLKFVRCIEEI